MKKTIIAMLLVLGLVFSLAACTDEKNDTDPSSQPKTSAPASEPYDDKGFDIGADDGTGVPSGDDGYDGSNHFEQRVKPD